MILCVAPWPSQGYTQYIPLTHYICTNPKFSQLFSALVICENLLPSVNIGFQSIQSRRLRLIIVLRWQVLGLEKRTNANIIRFLHPTEDHLADVIHSTVASEQYENSVCSDLSLSNWRGNRARRLYPELIKSIDPSPPPGVAFYLLSIKESRPFKSYDITMLLVAVDKWVTCVQRF